MNTKIEFLRRISNYLWNQTDNKGTTICYKHNIEHTGKNVYSIIIDTKLYDLTKNKTYFERAKKRAFRTIKTLVKDPDYGYWIFYPGRLDGRNMSNSVIDGGACVDSLSTFYQVFKDRLTEEERDSILDAIYKVSETYLKIAVVKKEVTNQRLWGGQV